MYFLGISIGMMYPDTSILRFHHHQYSFFNHGSAEFEILKGQMVLNNANFIIHVSLPKDEENVVLFYHVLYHNKSSLANGKKKPKVLSCLSALIKT